MWQVGDKAVCIDAAPKATSKGRWHGIVKGRVYTVSALATPGKDGQPRIQLEGIHYRGCPLNKGLNARRFRKVNEPPIEFDFREQLKQPKVKEYEDS